MQPMLASASPVLEARLCPLEATTTATLMTSTGHGKTSKTAGFDVGVAAWRVRVRLDWSGKRAGRRAGLPEAR